MRRTWIWVAIAGLSALAVAGCAGGGPSRSEFESNVQETRDRVDSALAHVTRAQSRQQLLNRMDKAALTIDRAAGDLDGAGAAEGFEDETGKLVKALRELSVDLAATAAQIRQPEFGDLLSGTRGLSFESWTKANSVFQQLRRQGIDVQPLARH